MIVKGARQLCKALLSIPRDPHNEAVLWMGLPKYTSHAKDPGGAGKSSWTVESRDDIHAYIDKTREREINNWVTDHLRPSVFLSLQTEVLTWSLGVDEFVKDQCLCPKLKLLMFCVRVCVHTISLLYIPAVYSHLFIERESSAQLVWCVYFSLSDCKKALTGLTRNASFLNHFGGEYEEHIFLPLSLGLKKAPTFWLLSQAVGEIRCEIEHEWIEKGAAAFLCRDLGSLNVCVWASEEMGWGGTELPQSDSQLISSALHKGGPATEGGPLGPALERSPYLIGGREEKWSKKTLGGGTPLLHLFSCGTALGWELFTLTGGACELVFWCFLEFEQGPPSTCWAFGIPWEERMSAPHLQDGQVFKDCEYNWAETVWLSLCAHLQVSYCLYVSNSILDVQFAFSRMTMLFGKEALRI